LDGLHLGRVRATVRAGTEHRVALVLRGRGLSPKVTDTDPHEIGGEVLESKALEAAAKTTAKAVNAFTKQAYKILKSHPVNRSRIAKGEPPANMIVLRGAGIYPDLVPITERLHLKSRLPSDVVVAITADHSTPVSVKEHSGDPVPLTIFGEGVRVDGVPTFDERSVAHGSLGRVRGQDVMNLLLDLSNRAPKYGA